MRRRDTCLLLGLTCLAVGCANPPIASQPDSAGASGKSPLESIRYERWRGAYRLTNATLRVVVVPSVGRIMELGLEGQPNALHINAELRGKSPRPGPTWMNFGGDWLWPVAQSRWTDFAPANWPPPPPIADAPWKAEAWINADGSQSCYLSREFGPPLNVLVSRLITVDRQRPQVRILQRMFRLRDSTIPVALWNVTQVGGASRAYLPADETLPGGFRAMMFDPPPPARATDCDGVWVFDTEGGEQFKLGANPSNGWIAAQQGATLVKETAHSVAQGPYPDGGCALELYSNPGLGYTEIETLSPEINLQPGETLENTLVIELTAMDPAVPPCEAASHLRHGQP